MARGGALERLMRSRNNKSSQEYSPEEQMDSIEEDDFLTSMSEDSRSALLKSVQSSEEDATYSEETEEDGVIYEEVEVTDEDEADVVYEEDDAEVTDEDITYTEEDVVYEDEDASVESAEEVIEEVDEEEPAAPVVVEEPVAAKPKRTRKPKNNNNVEEINMTNTKTNNAEMLSNYNKDKKPRKKNDKAAPVTKAAPVAASSFDPIMDQLAVNLIEDLQSNQFKLTSFDDNLMQILFDYMRAKFV